MRPIIVLEGFLSSEQEGQNHRPLGTATRTGRRQKRWKPQSHLSHNRSSAGYSPDPHFSQSVSSSSDSCCFDRDLFLGLLLAGFRAWVLFLSDAISVKGEKGMAGARKRGERRSEMENQGFHIWLKKWEILERERERTREGRSKWRG